ncbi:MAG: PQQ-binding-like beta-propeller repeat protein, partial [Candidatus Coatesbacteria bacterium]|nr:PQQ-binding-like beta-propeller repeat protein [Candidatus Coatesbacteria bacterium]
MIRRELSICLVAITIIGSLAALCSGIPIGLRSGPFDPDVAPPAVPDEFRYSVAEIEPTDFFIVQFDEPITPEMRARLTERGARILRYLPTYAFVVKMADAECRQLMDEGVLYHVELFQPYFKVSPNLFPLMESLGRAAPGEPAVLLTVQVFAGEDCDAVSKEIAASGLSVKELELSAGLRSGRIKLRVAGADVRELIAFVSRIKAVEWVEEWIPFKLNNHESRWIIQSYQEDYTPLWDAGLNGTGQLVAVGDTGVDADMCYFYDSQEGLPDDTINPDQRKIIVYYDLAGNGDWDGHDHGTHVSCTILGDNLANEGEPDADDGMAYNAKLVFLDVGDGGSLVGIPYDLNEYFIVAYNAGARIHSNSWGASVYGEYNTDSQACDEFMWSHADFLALFSNGNDGEAGSNSVESPATAKDVLSSGATENYYPGYDPEDMAYFSSKGPCDDGRLKPTVGAPGYYVVSADNDFNISSYNCGTRTMAGTSMSCPTHAGAVALVRQYFVDGYYPTGTANASDGFEPSGALMKAVMVNSGREMTGSAGGNVPNNTQGWGRTTLDDTLHFAGDETPLWVADETTGLQTGQSREYNVRVSAGRLEVTLVWTDYPAAAYANPCLVNDLDLEVTRNGTTYIGNVYSGGQSTTGGSADRLNPVECVQLNAPEAGNYTIAVHAHNVPEGPQPFALVISGVSGDTGPTRNWPMFRHDQGHTGRTSVCTFQTSPTVAWSSAFNASATTCPAEGTAGTIYSLRYSELRAWDPDGNHQWHCNVGSTGNSSPAVAPDGTVIVGSSAGVVTAVTPGGALAWTYDAGNAVNGPITIDKDAKSSFLTASGKAFLLDASGGLLWTFDTEVAGYSSYECPAMTDDWVYVGTRDGKVYQIENIDSTQDTIAVNLLASGLGEIRNSPALDSDGSVYVGSFDTYLCKIATDGTIAWSYPAGSVIYSSPAIGTDGTVVFGTSTGKIISLTNDGTLAWSFVTGDCISSSPAMDGAGNVVVGSWDRKVYHLDEDGNLNWSLLLDDQIWSSPVILQNGRIVVSGQTQLYCIARENTAPVLSADGFAPASGSVDTQFCFYVHYTDPDGDAASEVHVSVSGSEHEMTLDNGYAHDGMYAVWTTLPSGDHQIFYYAEDGFGGSARIPVEGTKQGPVVNHDPVLSNGVVTPSAGGDSIVFEYTVHYYDYEGQPPAEATVIMDDGTPETMTLESGDAADGNYVHSTTLSQGAHTYRFHFEDDQGRGVTAPPAGNYDGPTVGDYYEPDNSCEDAKSISNDGTRQYRSLMPEEDVDFVLFEAQARVHYVAQTYGNADTVMRLWADNCETPIAYDNDSGEGDNALIEWTCETSGIYHLSVEGYTSVTTGDYELELLLSNHLPELGAPSVDPKYGDAGDSFLYTIDYYDLDGDAPATMVVYVDGYPKVMGLAYGDPSDGTYEYTQLSLDAGAHTYRFHAVDAKGGEARLPDGGHFKGPFFIDDFESDNACRSAFPVVVGTSYYHTLCPPSDVDWIEFDAVAGERYVIRAFGLSSNFDTIIYLYESDCITLIESDDNGGSGVGSQMDWCCQTSGTYSVKVEEKFGDAGEYRLLVAPCGEQTPWTSFHHDNQNTGRTHYRGPTTPELKWTFDTGGDVFDSSAAIDASGRAYIGSRDDYIYAIDSDGTAAWSFDMHGFVDSGPAIDAEGNVYVDAWSPSPGGHLYKLNSSGAPVWSYYSRSGDSSPVVDDDGTIFVSSTENKFIAIASDGTLKWSYLLSLQASSHMCLDGKGHVYAGGWGYRVYCLDTENGHYEWDYLTDGSVESGIAIDSRGRVLFGSCDSKLYCLDSDGSFVWSYLTGYWLDTTPAIGLDDSVYCGSLDGVFYAIDPEGDLLWSYDVGDSIRSSPAIDGVGNLYFGSYDGNFYCLSPGGDLLWSYRTRDDVHCSPAIGPNQTVVFGSLDNKVYCLGGPENECPALSNESVNPDLGKSSNAFTYFVDCLDPDSDDISASTILIDDTPYEMVLSIGAATDGRYVHTTSTLTPGTHEYYFLFEDSDACETRYPASGAFSGPLVDDTRPWSDCSSPAITTDATIAVNFSAGDDGGSGLYNTKLYYRHGPGENWTYYNYLEGSGGTFQFFAWEGEGTYYFQTLALDVAGNLELGPIGDGDDSTIYDVTAPSSSCASPEFANASPIEVVFVANDADSGVSEVVLFYNYEGQGWTDSGVSSSGDATEGTLDFAPIDGDGTYEFYTIARDSAGYVEAAPGAADTATLYDTVAPESSGTSAQLANSSPIVVSFTASDALSGLAEVALWFNFNNAGWTDSGLTETGTSGSFDFTPPDGDGTYEFYTIARDSAGNVEPAPGPADTATRYDTAAPESSCTSPQSANSSPITVAFTASDSFSGIAQVALWFNFNGSGWTDSGLTEMGTSGSFDFTPAHGDGTYEFYTIAIDVAGNVERATGTADTTTLYDAAAPESSCTSPQYANSSPMAVSFTASDALSGIAEVALWFNFNGGAWTDSGLSETGASGSFDFAPANGEGTYEFYTIAADVAGNVEAAPATADDSTVYDTIAPQSTCTSA